LSTKTVLLAALAVAMANAHSILISPRPRNAIDTLDERWGSNGSSPDIWQPQFGNVVGAACACRNGTEPACLSGQTCLWMSVGCTIGCKECDGGMVGNKPVGTNPNGIDRCGSGKKATNNNPLHRTFNRNCTGACIGSVDDYTKFNPWRAPGSAPVYDPCGRAGGGPRPTSGKGEYVTTAYAKLGDLGSKLPTMPSGAVWQAGSVVEALWSVRANHGGGWQFRLCPSSSALTEECFQQTPIPFAGDSKMMMSNGEMLQLNSTFVSEGTLPEGSTWQMNPIPMTHDYTSHGDTKGHPFPPQCQNDHCPAGGCPGLSQGLCSGEWISNITMYDQLRVPAYLTAGEYVLGFRWDCESSAQVWQACADITITV